VRSRNFPVSPPPNGDLDDRVPFLSVAELYRMQAGIAMAHLFVDILIVFNDLFK